MNRSIGWIELAAAMLAGGIASAVVVTDNNLTSTSLGALTVAHGAPATSMSLPASPGRRVAISADIRSTDSPFTVNGLRIQGVSTGTAAQCFTYNLVNVVGGTPYPPTRNQLVFDGTNGLTYYLRPDINGNYWSWEGSNITYHAPAGADDGLIVIGPNHFGPNLVANASFEDTNVTFVGAGQSLVTNDVAKHGARSMRPLSTAESIVTVPLKAQKVYAYSFWANRVSGVVNFNQVEWGTNYPSVGFGAAPGNSVLYIGSVWTEITGVFTSGVAPAYFYIGACVNQDDLRLDSFYVGELKPPQGTVILIK